MPASEGPPPPPPPGAGRETESLDEVFVGLTKPAPEPNVSVEDAMEVLEGSSD